MDVVYLVREGPNEELRYSLRSLRNVPHDQVWIIGGAPGWVRNIEYVAVHQGRDRFDNTLRGWLTACTHPGISSDFQLWNDDFFALAPTFPEPRHAGTVEVRSVGNDPTYQAGKIHTARLLQQWGITPVLDYSTHTPMVINRRKGAAVLEKAIPAGIRALNRRILYGNYWKIGGEQLGNAGIGNRTQLPVRGEVWAATNDRTFAEGAVGRLIRELYPDPSPYEEA